MSRRIFIGLWDVAGYFGALQHGFTSAGIRADFYQLHRHAFRFRSDSPRDWLQRGFDYLDGLWTRTGKFRYALQATVVAAEVLLRGVLFLLAICRYSVFIFAGRSTFYLRNDLPLLHLLGKTVVFVFLGSDVRPVYLNGRSRTADPETIRACIAEAHRQRRSIRWIERWASLVVSHVPCSQFLSRNAVNFLALGIPSFPQRAAPETAGSGSAVRVLHSPSLPECKGTAVIRGMVERLRARGFAIDYREVTNVPHDRVLAEIRDCDIAVDQVYSDTPMAVFAAEAAGFGRPVVVGGYTRPEDFQMEAEDLPPTVFTQPSEMEKAIADLASNPDRRREAGMRAARFVRTRWSAETVARRLIRCIEGTAPEQWFFDPSRIRYVHGWGMSEKAGRDFIRAFMREGGSEALGIHDKPELLRRIREHVR
jgi:glycosyltransferase involved in cell wall biosynthesis